MENIDKKMPEYIEEDIYSERSLMQETWRRLKKSKLAMAGMYFLILLCVLSVVTFVIDVVTDKTFYNEHVIAQDLVNRLKGPSVNHIFGTDEFGRDIFLRIIWGTRYSLFMGIFAIGFAIVIGGIIGAIAGFYGRVTDNILMRFM